MRTKILAAILLITPLSCKESPPEPPLSPGPTPRIELTVSDVGVTEMWLRMRILDSAGQRGFSLTRDSQLLLFYSFGAPLDTVILDGGLVPGHTYTYRAYRFSHGNLTDSSVVQPRTLDTTSHNFTWEINTLGDGNSSAFYDVAIINDTLAYVVGEIYLKDSTGQIDANAYNAARWNGTHWSLMRVPFVGPCSAVDYPPIRALWAFSDNNILCTNGGSIVQFDGVNATMDCRMNSLLTGAITKIYAVSPQDVFAVGNVGTVVHFDGTSWQKLSSGTIVDINDVWGQSNGVSAGVAALAAASNRYTSGEKKLLRIRPDQSVEDLPWPQQRRLHSVWFASPRRIFLCGSGVFVGDGATWTEEPGLAVYFSTRVRGTAINNLFVVGTFGLFLHFNGIDWQTYPDVFLANGTLEGLAVSDRLVIAVGQLGNQGVIVRGYKQ